MMQAPPPPDGFVIDDPAAAPLRPLIPRQPPPHPVQTPDETRRDRALADQAELDAARAREDAARRQLQQGSVEDTMGQLRIVIRNARRAQELSRNGLMTTGFGANLMQDIAPGGTSAAELRSILSNIGSNVAFDRLQRMRQESPTGGAVGNVSDRDLQLLRDTISSMDPGVPDEVFQRNMQDIIDAYSRVYQRLGGRNDDIAAPEGPVLRDIVQPAVETTARVAATPPPAAPPGTPPPSAPPESGVGGVPLAHALPDAPAVPPGAEQFQRDLQAALDAGQMTSAQDIIDFGRQHGFNIDPQQAEQAIRATARGARPTVRTPTFQTDISDVRGPDTAMERFDAFGRGAADVVTLGFGDELRAFGGAFRGMGSYESQLARERAINAYDENQHFGTRLGGQLAGGFALPFTRGAGAGRLALESAGYGGAYGIGSGEGWNRITRGVTGSAIGAAIPMALNLGGRGVGAAIDRYRGAGITDEGRAVAQAADAEGIPISPPIAEPARRGRMAVLESSLGSHGVIQEGLGNTQAALEGRAGTLGGTGTVEEGGVMGQRIQEAGQRYIRRSRGTRDRLYSRAESLAGNRQVLPTEAVQRLDSEIAALSGNRSTNANEIGFLQSIRADLVDGNGNLIPKTVQQIRDLRTSLRSRVNEAGLTFSQAEGRVLGVLDSARSDISRDLGAVAPEAVRAYARADAFNARRADEIRQVVQSVIGQRNNNLGGEQVMARIQTLASPRGNSARLERLWDKLTPQEQSDAAATIAESAGRQSPNDAFTPGRFLVWARQFSPPARRTIFGDAGAQSIANLEEVSRALVDTRKALNNSRSGFVMNMRAALRDFVSGGVPGAVIGMSTGSGAIGTGVAGMAVGASISTAGAARRYISARMMMSPDMTRWLRTTATASTPSAVRRQIGRLTVIAARDPAIAQEVTGLQNWLTGVANDNLLPATGRAAASPDEGPNQQQ